MNFRIDKEDRLIRQMEGSNNIEILKNSSSQTPLFVIKGYPEEPYSKIFIKKVLKFLEISDMLRKTQYFYGKEAHWI